VTGMSQAGSTLCYNLIRLLIEQSYNNYKVMIQAEQMGSPPSAIYTHDIGGPKTFVIAKQHDLPISSMLHSSQNGVEYKKKRDTGAIPIIIFNVRRDVRDTTASNLRKNPQQTNVVQIAKTNITYYSDWAPVADYEWVYEDYKKNPIEVTKKMQDVLGDINLNEERLMYVVHKAETIKDLAPETLKNVEPFTRLKSEHITNNGKIQAYRDILTDEQIELLENTFGDWLKEKDYME